MIANNGMFLFFKRLFAQLLSALKLVEGVPVGMYNSVIGNDAVFVGGNCFRGNSDAFYRIDNSNFDSIEHFQIDDWVRTTALSNGQIDTGQIATKYNFSGSRSWLFSKPDSAGNLKFSILSSNGTNYTLESATNINLIGNSNITHITIKVYGSNVESYVNGTLVDSILMDSNMQLHPVPICVGATNTGASAINEKWQQNRFKYTELESNGTIKIGGEKADIVFSSYINNAGQNTALDAYGRNNATLINGSPDNRGIPNKYFWDQLGVGSAGECSSLVQQSYIIKDGPQEGFPLPMSMSWQGILKDHGSTSYKRFYSIGGYEVAYRTDGTLNFIVQGASKVQTQIEFLQAFRLDITIDASRNINLYIGGTLINPSPVDAFTDPVTSKVTIANNGGLTAGGECIIGFAKHFNRVLTAQEITTGIYGLTDKADYPNGAWVYMNDAYTVHVPASTFDITKDALGNVLTILNNNDFKNTGTKLKQPDVESLKVRDTENVWFDTTGTPKDVTFEELETAINNYPETYGGEVVSGKSIKNISLK